MHGKRHKIILTIGLLTQTGCAGPENSISSGGSGILSFSYSYDGTIGGNSYNFEIRQEDSGITSVTYESMEFSELGEMKTETEEDLTARLEELYHQYGAAQWNGRHDYDPDVMDGSGFSISILFTDGKTYSLSGFNAEPDGYREFEIAFLKLAAPYLQTAKEEAIQKKIDEGISGDLNFVMADLIGNGTSGSDKYEILISTPSEDRKNIDIRIRSDSGEFWPVGTWQYYTVLSEEEIGFDRIAALIEKYNVIQWYGWQKDAQDYQNSEWFQFSFSFENSSINAMGTEHPENYDDFRKEFLTEIRRITDLLDAEEQ